MRDLIRELSDMRAISGSEYRINKKIAEMLMPYADETRIDALGNVAAVKECGIENAPNIMIEAHCDEIGLIVTDITDEGFITFGPVGGIDARILPASEVTVHGRRDIKGVIGIKPDWLTEKGKAVKIKDMAVDTGMTAEDVRSLVSIGDGITLPQSVGALGKKQFSGKTLDDRACLAAVIETMRRLCGRSLKVNVYACAHVQEEVGCRGAKVSAFNIMPDMAIAIDVTHGITPDNSDNAFPVGKGVTISVGPNIHPRLSERLISIAGNTGIKYAVEVDGGDTGTDAWEIQCAGTGIPTALLSVPLKYMHTSVETLAISDVKSLVKLLVSFIESQEGNTEWLKL